MNLLRLYTPFFWLLVSSAWAAEPLPTRSFTAPAEYESLRISPDGTYFAAVVPYEGQNALAVIHRESGQVTGTIRLDLNQKIGRVYWVNKERVVAKVLSRQSDNDRTADFGELFAIDADGKRRKLVFGYRSTEMGTGSRIRRAEGEWAWGDLLDPLLDDRKHALVISYPFSAAGDATPTVYQLNVYTGTKRPVTRLPLPRSGAAVNPSQTHWAAFGTDPEGIPELHVRSEQAPEWRRILRGSQLDESISVVSVAEDGTSLVALSDIGRATRALVRIDTQTGAQTALIEDARYDIYRVELASDGRTVLGACFRADRPRCDYLDDVRGAKILKQVQAAFTEQFMTASSWTQDGSEAILFVYADRNPGDYFLLNAKTMKVDYLLSSRSWIDPNQMAPMEPIRFTARDGLEVEGYFTRPLGSVGPVPTVVLVHGGPHGPRDIWKYGSETQLLANRGYGVLNVNYRGSGGYGLPFERAGHRRWGTTIQDDITDGVRWAVENGLADANRLCISGGSFGGYSALMSAAREPDLYRCAIGHVGVYDMALMFEKGDIPDVRGGREYLELVLSTNPDLHQAQSPVHQVDRIKAALLISYGQRDERAPPIQSTRLVEALKKAGKDFELIVERREGHGFSNPETQRAFLENKLAFLNRHIAPVGGARQDATAAR
ncbi:MAG: prolyl oligopeptidase family serine peptidase [Pseudomonadota bacterium]